MKKTLFTMVLATLLCVVKGFTVQAAPEEVIAPIPEEEEGILTIEVIENSFWEELVEKSTNDAGSKEDAYIKELINLLDDEPKQKYYHDEGNITFGAWLNKKNVNFERILQKYEKIVELYNQSHEIQFKVSSQSVNDSFCSVDIESTNLYPIFYLGQLAYVQFEDAKFWESSAGYGSGKYGTLPKGALVYVDKVSYLDENGNPTETVSLENEAVQIDIHRRRMLHIKSDSGEDKGWVYTTSLRLPQILE